MVRCKLGVVACTGIVLQDVLLALITPSQASILMGQLAPAVPLKGLQHLKRLRRLPEPQDGKPALELLLCPLPSVLPAADGKAADTQYTSWPAQTLEAAGAPGPAVQLVAEHGLRVRRAQVKGPQHIMLGSWESCIPLCSCM